MDEKKRRISAASGHLEDEGHPVYEAYVSGITDGKFRAVLGGELILEYRDGRFEMRFTDQDMHSASAGRGVRYVHIQQIENVRILTDVSIGRSIRKRWGICIYHKILSGEGVGVHGSRRRRY